MSSFPVNVHCHDLATQTKRHLKSCCVATCYPDHVNKINTVTRTASQDPVLKYIVFSGSSLFCPRLAGKLLLEYPHLRQIKARFSFFLVSRKYSATVSLTSESLLDSRPRFDGCYCVSSLRGKRRERERERERERDEDGVRATTGDALEEKKQRKKDGDGDGGNMATKNSSPKKEGTRERAVHAKWCLVAQEACQALSVCLLVTASEKVAAASVSVH
ncbi:hypothetical protein AXG93_285s1270 [Marchantia polymorpha subsp. ruderalis]|uniref:Uncharacterized protein n=1 Tax=Marchantia polymorpha subsp. ruderalis TaxID=1480154 RepID=A0A176VRK9_MARPO|nr:hypothetical protein AXG93_285s1270 [Marchantia polymorpha subsp. ruderalis]